MLFDINPTSLRIRLFEAKFIPEPMSGCWLWLGGSNEKGYGIFWNGDRLEKAHRFSYRAYRGVLARTQDCLHICDNPACVNPHHVRPGTPAQNTGDMWSRNRAAMPTSRGTFQAQAKLTDEKAEAIRRTYAAGGVTQRELARENGVSQRLIWNVIHDLNWFAPSGLEIRRGLGK